MASLSLFVIERHSRVWLLRLLIPDSSKSSIKIAYPERNGMRKTPTVTVKSVNCLKALSLDVKLLKALPNCPVTASLSLFQTQVAQAHYESPEQHYPT